MLKNYEKITFRKKLEIKEKVSLLNKYQQTPQNLQTSKKGK